MTTATGQPDLGNVLDAIFKAPFEDALHALEGAAEGEAATVVQTAQADAAAAVAALAKAAASSQAALDAVVGPDVQKAVSAIATSVPVVGPIIAGEAGQVASVLAVSTLNAIIAELQKLAGAHA